MLTIGANLADSHASHTLETTDEITQNTRASLLRIPGELDRHARLLPIGERYAGQTGTAPHREASEQQGRAGWSACLAAWQKARSEGWKFSTSPGLSADRGAGPLPERGKGRL